MLQLLLNFLLYTGHFGAEPRGPPISVVHVRGHVRNNTCDFSYKLTNELWNTWEFTYTSKHDLRIKCKFSYTSKTKLWNICKFTCNPERILQFPCKLSCSWNRQITHICKFPCHLQHDPWNTCKITHNVRTTLSDLCQFPYNLEKPIVNVATVSGNCSFPSLILQKSQGFQTSHPEMCENSHANTPPSENAEGNSTHISWICRKSHEFHTSPGRKKTKAWRNSLEKKHFPKTHVIRPARPIAAIAWLEIARKFPIAWLPIAAQSRDWGR